MLFFVQGLLTELFARLVTLEVFRAHFCGLLFVLMVQEQDHDCRSKAHEIADQVVMLHPLPDEGVSVPMAYGELEREEGDGCDHEGVDDFFFLHLLVGGFDELIYEIGCIF